VYVILFNELLQQKLVRSSTGQKDSYVDFTSPPRWYWMMRWRQDTSRRSEPKRFTERSDGYSGDSFATSFERRTLLVFCN